VTLPAPPAAPKGPPLQFTVWGLMLLMLGFSFTAALAYYMRRGFESTDASRLVGMIVVLAGPMLLLTVVSLLVALVQWRGRR
jgi:hypothetical protein